MTPIKSNRAPLTKRISVLAITAAATFSFAVFSPSAQAATPLKPTKEFIALSAALTALGVTIDSADADQLGQAVANAIANPANVKLKPGNIAGEALKYAAAQDAGDEVGVALRNASATDNDQLIARDAIKRAATGKDINVNSVPDFSTEFVASNPDAYALAKLVISSKAAAGAVIGGRASEIDQADRFGLADLAVKSKALGGFALSAATQDILKYVVIEAAEDFADTDAFTTQVALANTTLASKIGAGGVAGDPKNGGAIVDSLLNQANLPKLKSGASSFITAVGKVADIEEMSKIAIAVGTQISTAAGKTTAIKFSAANGIVKALAKAIIAKSTTVGSNNQPSSPITGTNKQDEIAEVVAYMVGKILNPATVQGTGGGKPQVTIKNAGAKIFALVMSAVNATKPKKVQDANPGIYVNTAQDVAGSVAETLASMRDIPGQVILPEFFDAIKAYLIKKASSIGGKANVALVTQAINDAYETAAGTSAPDPRFEDGSAPNLAGATTSDPETDFRPF
jgi:hypothetical protein